MLLLPLFFVSFARAARRASRDADVVHAHWLPSAVAALATRKPFVLQAWGIDVELARRLPWLFRPLVRRARVVVCASRALAADVRALGAREVRVIPSGVEMPDSVVEPEEPPHVLYVGRLSEEKGVRELAEAARGPPARRRRRRAAARHRARSRRRRRPRRARRRTTSGPRSCASRRAARATASSRGRRWRTGGRSSRPASGGLPDAVEDGVTGLVVPPGDVAALRAALERLLADGPLRRQLGTAARAKAEAELSWPAATAATLAVYEEAAAQAT